MHTLIGFTSLVLCTIAPSIGAIQHHHFRHRHSNGLYPTGLPFSSGVGPLPSGAPTIVPYPAGNGTLRGGGTSGTGVTATISNTVYTTIESTIYQTAPEAEVSPASTGLVGAPEGGNEFLAMTTATIEGNAGASSQYADLGSGSSSAVSGLAAGASSCAAPITVTVSSDIYVTITAAGSPSQAPSASEAPTQSQPVASISSPASPQPIVPSHTAILSESASVTPLASAPVIPSASSAAAALGPVSSNDGVASSALPSTSSTLPEEREDQPGFVPPTLSITTAALPSDTAQAVVETPPASVAASTAAATTSSSSTGSKSLIPNGKKAGVAGYRSITEQSSWTEFTSHIGWYSDYWPDTPDSGSVTGVGMLWGDGHLGTDDASRLTTFKSLSKTPKYMMGFYEPDWTPPDSSDIDPTTAATLWSTTLAPLGKKGTLLGSPSLATQYDEKWLTPFADAPEHPTWDFTCIHTNKPNVTGVKEDVEYYLAKYKKPIWVSEFACVDDQHWAPCTDAAQIKTFIQDVVEFFQGNDSVIAYGYSNGNGLGTVWPMIDKSGTISASGQVYLDAISAL